MISKYFYISLIDIIKIIPVPKSYIYKQIIIYGILKTVITPVSILYGILKTVITPASISSY